MADHDPDREADGFDQRRYLFEEMTDDERVRLLRELGGFAATCVRRYRWNGAPPSPRDLVMANLEEVLTDPYRWKPERRRRRLPAFQCLEKYLFEAIWRDVQRLKDRREERDRAEAIDRDGESRLDRLRSRGRSPEERLEDRQRGERAAQVGRFMQSRGYAVPFWLYFVLELKPREIAARLGLPPRRVWSIIQQMKELIRRNFDDAPDDDEPEHPSPPPRGMA